MNNNSNYKLTNVHNVVTIIETKNNRVKIVDGFSTGDAGTIKEFTKFIIEKAKEGQPIKVEEINQESNK